ncbi:MAG: hypothetical protein E7359_02170 [Clostridiales bacterium]|nr:hypothetical protein [Clostridiales bacterium]
MILLLSGSSCSGKNTLIKELVKNNENLKYITTFTSREKRPGEIEGDPYHFITKEDFQKKIKNGDFYEHELIHENFYGVEKNLCLDLLNKNYSLIKDIGVEGTFNLKDNLKDKNVETVYLKVSKGELRKRLINRGDKKEDINRRLKRFQYEASYIKKYNFLIHNKNFDKSYNLINAVINNNKVFYEYIKPCKKIVNINLKKLDKYTNKLINNKSFKPIKVYFNGQDFILKNNLEKYLAGILVNKNVTKQLIFKNVKFKEVENIENVLNFIKINI